VSVKTRWERVTLNARTALHTRRLLSDFSADAETVQAIQERKLQRLLTHAFETFPFYRDRFQQAGLHPRDIRRTEDLAQLPLLTKDEYRDFTLSVVEKRPQYYAAWYLDGTSGSTGMPLRIWRTWEERAYMVAKWMRTLFLNGYRWTDVTFSLPSPHRLQKDSLLQRFGVMRRYSVAYTAPVEEMVEQYLKVRPTVLYANKSQLVQMALFCSRRGIALPRPRFYVCAAETLDANSRSTIVEAFGDRLFEVYGGTEFNNLAFQIIGEDYLHFSHTTNVLELLEDGAPREDRGYCAITDLHIYSFPLIRYQLGDYIETEVREGLRVIKKIRGRLDDWVIFEDGTRKPFHPFYEIMERRPEVRQFRIVQETLRHIRVLVVRDPASDPEKLAHMLIHDLRSEVRDNDVDYTIEWKDDIPPDPNGKLRMIVSNLKQA